ncbi:MAG: hypothetical protein ABSA75_07995 [Candidatus Bathyarchaeia archaeon]|jgi:hypothetical protein
MSINKIVTYILSVTILLVLKHNTTTSEKWDEKMKQELTDLSIQCSLFIQDESTKTTFETAITESIDDILSAFGNNIKQTIYHHLENIYDIKKDEIPLKIQDFANALEQTFGSVAKLIEIKIIERLHAKYRDFFYVPKKGELDFAEFVSNFQRYLESQA